MSRFSLVAVAAFLALPGIAVADDGGMAAPGGQVGGTAAPPEAPPAAVEAPVTDPAIGGDTAPPPDIGPHGPNHAGQAYAAPVPEGPSRLVAASGDPLPVSSPAHDWPRASGNAAPPIEPPGELIGSTGPGAAASAVSGGGGVPAWILAAIALATLCGIAATAAHRAATQAARGNTAQGLHRFA